MKKHVERGLTWNSIHVLLDHFAAPSKALRLLLRVSTLLDRQPAVLGRSPCRGSLPSRALLVRWCGRACLIAADCTLRDIHIRQVSSHLVGRGRHHALPGRRLHAPQALGLIFVHACFSWI